MKTATLLRRLLAGAVGLLVAAGGVLALATPASATTTPEPQFLWPKLEVAGDATCDPTTGEWHVEWTVSNNRLVRDVTVTKVTPDIDGLDKGDVIKKNSSTTVVQTLSGDTTSASLEVKVEWKRWSLLKKRWKYHTDKDSDEVELGKCVKETTEPSATPADFCDKTVLTLANGAEATVDAHFQVSSANFQQDVTVKPGESETVTVPGSEENIKVFEENTLLLDHDRVTPENCTVKVIHEADCDALYLLVKNPELASETTVKLTSSTGEEHEVTLAGGEQSEVIEFTGGEGVTVTVNVDGNEFKTVAWEEPEDCEEPSDEPSEEPALKEEDDTTDELAATGSPTALVAGGALLLLTVGGAMFIMARRRRITFTA